MNNNTVVGLTENGRIIASEGYSGGQSVILTKLEEGNMSIGKIAQDTGIDPRTVGILVNKLSSQGLVRPVGISQ